ncbi:MAG: M43 family zinc metalloprotease [Sporocytophaga sp.]|nr:M43 family zinc metalloprotease [Sporocytophaga sp.]
MRILKKSLLLIFLAISSVSAIAQDYIENKNSAKFSYQDLQNYIAKEKASRANGEMEYIPIQLHLVENNIGNRGNLFEIYESLKGTNALFKAINLNFYICSEINIIKSKEFYDLDSDDENSRLVSTDFNRNAINVYFVGNINFIDACGYASLGPMSQPGYIVMQNSCASVRVMAHELGHYFSLYHTHDPIGGPEFVNGTNCKTAGDLLCDTPADPNIFNKVDFNCNYTGDDKDPNGMPYSPPVHNVMAYTTSKCTREFTAEQYSKMQMYHDQYGRNFLFCSPKPDFSVKLLNSSFLIKGTTQQIDLTIENFSPEAYSGNLSLKLFLIDGAEQATEIYNDIVNENWSGYDSLPFSFSAMIPSSLKDGAYTLLAKVNDNNIPEESVVKNNSDRVKIGVYGQNAKLPDLAVSITGEETYEVGYDYVMNIHISNIGTATMEHAGIDIFISEDPFLTSDDLRIGPYGYGSMEPGQSYDSEFAITLPQNTLKPYFVLAYVDRYNDELEYLESNNFAVHKVNGISPAANRKTADLQIVNYRYLNGPKSTLNVLSQLQFRLDFKNLGPEKVRSTFLGLFLSKDNSKSPDDLLLDEKNSGLGLYTDEGDDFLTALIPKSVALGDYYFIIQLNSRGYTKESDTNAIKLSSFVIHIILPMTLFISRTFLSFS